MFPQHIAAHQHFNDCDSFAVLDFVASDSVLAGSELQLGDAVVSVNGNPFNSREKFVALLYEESDVTLQTVRLDEVPSDEDYLSLARSAMLSRISSTTSMRAKVVFAWQTFARSDEQACCVCLFHGLGTACGIFEHTRMIAAGGCLFTSQFLYVCLVGPETVLTGCPSCQGSKAVPSAGCSKKSAPGSRYARR